MKYIFQILLCKLAWPTCALLLFSFPANAQNFLPYKGTHTYMYQGYFGGFHVGDVKVLLDLSDNRYQMVTSLQGKGILQYLFKVKGNSTSIGAHEENTLIPNEFRSQAFWKGSEFNGEVLFKHEKEPAFTYAPEEKAFEQEKYPEGSLVNTIDPASFPLHVAMAVSRTGSCQIERRLFSGRNLHNVSIENIEIAALPKNSIIGERTGLLKCRLSVEKVYPEDHSKSDLKPFQITLYMATDDPKSIPYPLLIEGKVRGVISRVWLTEHEYTPHGPSSS